jgi:hypothetical protein
MDTLTTVFLGKYRMLPVATRIPHTARLEVIDKAGHQLGSYLLGSRKYGQHVPYLPTWSARRNEAPAPVDGTGLTPRMFSIHPLDGETPTVIDLARPVPQRRLLPQLTGILLGTPSHIFILFTSQLLPQEMPKKLPPSR